MKPARGITRIEVLVVTLILLILVVISLLLSAPSGRRALTVRDATQIRVIHATLLTLSRDFDGFFTPDPRTRRPTRALPCTRLAS